MDCSIVIPTRLRAALLAETLDSLRGQGGPSFEVIVVCDGEDPETRALAARYAACYALKWIFLPENRGRAAARNAGVSAASGEVVLFLDDDTLAAPGWVARHWTRQREAGEGKGAVVCGLYVPEYPGPPGSYTERYLREGRERWLKDAHAWMARTGGPRECDLWCGLNCSVRRSTFWAAGGFNPAFPDVGEDLDLGVRLYNLGVLPVFEPSAVLRHRFTKDLRSYPPWTWKARGKSDWQRALDRRQRNIQTRRLTWIWHAPFLHRITERFAWQYPQTARKLSATCKRFTDATGSRFFFRAWSKLITASEYWEGVRGAGASLSELRALVGSPLAVLSFHSISRPLDRQEAQWCVSPSRFARFMGWLRVAGYRFLKPDQLLDGATPPRSVLLTFDDGYADFYNEVYPMVSSLGLKATVFLVADRIGQSNTWDESKGFRSRPLLSLAQIREMHKHGVEFGSHSLTHAWLPELPQPELRREVIDSKKHLEDLLGSEVVSFAYPFGGFDERARAMVAEAGYEIAFGTRPNLSFWEDRLSISRINICERDTLLDFHLKITTGKGLASGAGFRPRVDARVSRALRSWPPVHGNVTARSRAKAGNSPPDGPLDCGG